MKKLTAAVIEAEGRGFDVHDKLSAFPTLEDALTLCPLRDGHTVAPRGYIEHATWAEEKSKTHKQERCEGCGRFLVWVRK